MLPGDLKAAQDNDVLFYPIIPGDEEASWDRFRDEALRKFFDRNYEGAYQENLLKAFDDALPESPHWK